MQQAQLKAAASVNSVLIEIYWDLGKEMILREKDFAYGENFIGQVATELKHEFPGIKGFSRRNLYAIRQWYLFFSSHGEVVHQAVAQLPWRHQLLLVQKFKDLEIILLYTNATHKNNWSRDTLEANINNAYHLRVGKADHNFEINLAQTTIGIIYSRYLSRYSWKGMVGLGSSVKHPSILNQPVASLMKRLWENME